MAVNILDYRDADHDVTFHDNGTPAFAADDVYGHERQPYINEFFVGIYRTLPGSPEFRAVAIELHNPYDTPINLYQWELRIDLEGAAPTSAVVVLDDGSAGPTTWIPAGGYLTVVSTDPPQAGESYVFDPPIESDSSKNNTIVLDPPSPPDPPAGRYALPWPVDNHTYRIQLVRARQIGLPPDPRGAPVDTNGQLIVDDTVAEIAFPPLVVPTFPVPPPDVQGYLDENVRRRDAEANKFEVKANFVPLQKHTLGKWNDPANTTARYSVPIPNLGANTFGSVGDLGEVLTYSRPALGYDLNGNQSYTGYYALTTGNAKERYIKFDLSGDWYAGGPDNKNRRVLDLFCVNRPDHDGLDNDADGAVDEPDEAEWPVYGRININTASRAMLQRALSKGPFSPAEADDLAWQIVTRRETVGPFTHIGDLFRGGSLADAMKWWGSTAEGTDNDSDGVPADPTAEEAEKDERDARFRYLANLVTTRSNVFTVMVTVEIYRDADNDGAIDVTKDEFLASRKAIAVLDRSRAKMTVKYTGTTRVSYVERPVVQRDFRWISD